MSLRNILFAGAASLLLYSGINAQSDITNNAKNNNSNTTSNNKNGVSSNYNNSSNTVINAPENKFVPPKIPSFYREFETTVHVPLISSDGEVYWRSKTYTSKEKHNITEIRGHADIDVKAVFVGLEKIYVGFITRIDEKDNTIETIIYNNGPDTSKITAYDKQIAARENINLTDATSMSHHWADYKNNYLEDLEFKVRKPLDNAVSFQEGYFMIPKEFWSNANINIHYKGEFIQMSTHIKHEEYDDEYYKVITIDMTRQDPNDPTKRSNVIAKINSLKVYLDKNNLPEIVVAEMIGPLGILVDAEARYIK